LSISLVTTGHRRAWRWRKQPLKRPLGSGPMQAKRTWRTRGIFTGATLITTVLWLNWKLPAELCRTIRKYCFLPACARGVRVGGKNPPEALNALLILTRAILEYCRTLKETMRRLGAMLTNKCG